MKTSLLTICILVAGGCLVVTNGCASFQGNNLEPVRTFPSTSVKKSVDVDFALARRLNGKEITSNQRSIEKRMAKICIKRMNRSNLFGEVSREQQSPDLKVRIVILHNVEADEVGTILNALTLTIYPGSVIHTFYLKANITDTHTGQQHTIKLTDSVTMWSQLLLLPVTPFKYPNYENTKCTYTLYDNMCLEIYRAGMFDSDNK